MRRAYLWAGFLVPLTLACASGREIPATAFPMPIGTETLTSKSTSALAPTATALALTTTTPTPTPTRTPSPTPTPREIDPLVQELIAGLNNQDIQTRQTGRVFSDETCMYEHESVLHSFIFGNGVRFGIGQRFDLYPFEDEQAASAIASNIPPDAECRGGSKVVDWVAELPYFQCGALIAFVQSADEGLSKAFEELCGPPFARTYTSGLFRQR